MGLLLDVVLCSLFISCNFLLAVTSRCSVTARMNSDGILDSSPSWALTVLFGGLGLPRMLAGQCRMSELSDGLQLESEKPTPWLGPLA